MAQRRHEGFGQKLHAQKADRQPAAKGAVNAAIEVSFQDRSKSAERPRRPSSYLSTRRHSSGPGPNPFKDKIVSMRPWREALPGPMPPARVPITTALQRA